jgi:SAM-dependent methyltransferase
MGATHDVPTPDLPTPNQSERRRWNDQVWVSRWLKRERFAGALTRPLLERLDVRPGERVLDVGCGGGRTTLVLSRLVGPAGLVVGCDISAPLLRIARRRAEEDGVSNVRFVEIDAQCDSLEGAPFTAAMSQFGVMFFDDPVAAFANIRRHVADGGRFVFVCWQVAERNNWHLGEALVPFVAPASPPEPGRSTTGPFDLGDADRTARLLGAAGWSDVERTACEMTVTVPREALVDEGQLDALGVPEEHRAAAWHAVQRHLARFERADGRLDVPVAAQVFAAMR